MALGRHAGVRTPLILHEDRRSENPTVFWIIPMDQRQFNRYQAVMDYCRSLRAEDAGLDEYLRAADRKTEEQTALLRSVTPQIDNARFVDDPDGTPLRTLTQPNDVERFYRESMPSQSGHIFAALSDSERLEDLKRLAHSFLSSVTSGEGSGTSQGSTLGNALPVSEIRASGPEECAGTTTDAGQ